MRFIPARPFCNNTRQLIVLPSEVSHFVHPTPLFIAALKQPISSNVSHETV